MTNLSDEDRERLVEMVQRVLDAQLSDDEEDELLEQLRSQLNHPRLTDLMFYAEPPLSADQVVEAALNYRSIEL